MIRSSAWRSSLTSLGFLVRDLGPSQLAFDVIRNANKFVQRGGDAVAFFENPSPFAAPPLFATMHVIEANGFRGAAVATSLSTAAKLLRCPSPGPKAFYVHDLEWVRFARKSYRELAAIYRHPNLTLLTRNVDYADAIADAWDRDVIACHLEPETILGVLE